MIQLVRMGMGIDESLYQLFVVLASGMTIDLLGIDLRHMFASFMLSNGADLAAASKLLGIPL